MTAFTSLGIKDADDLAAFLAVVVPPRTLQYARTASDQMRVFIDATASYLPVDIALGPNGTIPLWYAAQGSPTSMDAREPQREASNQSFLMQRSNWTF